MEAKKNFLRLSTTDLELGISYWTLAKTEKEGTITVPVKFLSSFVSLLTPNQLNLEIKNNILFIENKDLKAQIKGQDANEFPIIPKIETKNFIEIDSFSFAQGIAQVINFCALNQIHPEISGVFLSLQNNILKITTTDSFRLAEKTLYLENQKALKCSFILPQKTARELVNIFSEKTSSFNDKIEKLKIYFSPAQILFELSTPSLSFPSLQIVSKLIEGEYPNYQEIIPQKFETKITLKKEDFLKQIKQAGLFSQKINEVKIKVSPSKNQIEIFSQNPELGENSSIISGKVDGKETEVSFNYRFLLDGVLNIKSQQLIFELNGETGPACLRSAAEKDYFYIVMPIKTV